MLRVFLVEDESTIRATLRDTVPWDQVGYEFAGEAGDGEMALPLLRQARPDVLITDIRMPFMDGLELSRLELDIRAKATPSPSSPPRRRAPGWTGTSPNPTCASGTR